MRGAGRISAAYSKIEDQNKFHEEQNAKLKAMRDEQEKKSIEINRSLSHHDDQMSITNERK